MRPAMWNPLKECSQSDEGLLPIGVAEQSEKIHVMQAALVAVGARPDEAQILTISLMSKA
jgi:hypothetical protein